MKTIKIDGIEYVPEDSIVSTPVKDFKGMKYCIVRTYSAGVFAGYIKDKAGRENVVYNARRLWSWSGASSLSQLSQDGVSKPNDCNFPMEVPEVSLKEIIEILPCSEKAKSSIDGVPIWKK